MRLFERHKGWISAQAHIRSSTWTKGEQVFPTDGQGFAVKGPGTTYTTHHYVVEVTVKPEGQPAFESTIYTDRTGLQNGGETYVLYDPGQPERCEIDMDRLKKEFEHEGGAGLAAFPAWRVDDLRAEEAAKHGQKLSEPTVGTGAGVAGPTSEDVPAQLAKLGELHASGTITDAEFIDAKAHVLDE